MKKFLSFALLAMLLLGCDSPSGYYPSGGDGSNKSYVVTGEATDVTHKSVILLGEIKVDIADYETIEWGVMYSADKDELESHIGEMVVCKDALIENAYRVELSDLASETKYYYCAYINLNNKQYKFGETKEFTTLAAPKIDGIGVFSVSADKQVTFSKGNLQYHPAKNKWRFAENQTDYIGAANRNIAADYDGWIDLFGWSTSATYFGVSTSIDWENDYLGPFVDWGTNQIGVDAPNTWRTLSYDEWSYLRWERPNYSELCGVAQVNGVNGLVLLPDNWTCPSGVTFKSGFHSNSGVDYYAAYQSFTTEQWSKLEAAGAVFLPAAGRRYGSSMSYVQNYGCYWSATEKNSDYVYDLFFYSGEAYLSGGYRTQGYSVRLVKDL